MADYFNQYHLKHFAGTVAQCMEIDLPKEYAPGISWLSKILKTRLGGSAERAILFHAGGVGMNMWQKYTDIFAAVYSNTSVAFPFCSTENSISPVAHASMYTGLMPSDHGVDSYSPQPLSCSTLYDELIKIGKHPVIIAHKDSSFLHLFRGRDMKVYICNTGYETIDTAIKVIEEEDYDLLSIHMLDYDTASHSCGPEAKDAKNALDFVAEDFDRIVSAAKYCESRKRTLISYSPDHGQHQIDTEKGGHGTALPDDMNILHFFGTI